jgi:hypothetical protein
MTQPPVKPYNKDVYDDVETFIVLFKASVSEKSAAKKLEIFPLFGHYCSLPISREPDTSNSHRPMLLLAEKICARNCKP